MPITPKRPCLGSPQRPRCGALVERGRCRLCASTLSRAKDRGRETAQQRGYTSHWARVSQQHLRQYPLCGMRAPDAYPDGWRGACHEQGRITAAECTDHIRPHKGDQNVFWDRRNFQALCANCNRIKGIRYEGGFGRAMA